MKVFAVRDTQYLIVDEDWEADGAEGFIFDREQKSASDPINISTILAQGYWEQFHGDAVMVLQEFEHRASAL